MTRSAASTWLRPSSTTLSSTTVRACLRHSSSTPSTSLSPSPVKSVKVPVAKVPEWMREDAVKVKYSRLASVEVEVAEKELRRFEMKSRWPARMICGWRVHFASAL